MKTATKPRRIVFQNVGPNLYRLESTGGYYALLKKGAKQFRRSLKTKGRKLKGSRTPKVENQIALIGDAKRCLARACRLLSFPKFTHHDFRHFFATTCIESGVDIPTVSRWLGHKDGGALAMRVYGHLRQDHSVAMVGRVLFN
jgi:integrase